MGNAAQQRADVGGRLCGAGDGDGVEEFADQLFGLDAAHPGGGGEDDAVGEDGDGEFFDVVGGGHSRGRG